MYSLHYFPDDIQYPWYIKNEHGLDYGRYCSRISGSKVYEKLVKTDFDKAKEALKKANVPMSGFSIPTISTADCTYTVCDTAKCNSLGNCKAATRCTTDQINKYICPPVYCNNNPIEKDAPMTEYTMEVDQRNHMKRRLDTLTSNKQSELMEKFFMNTDNLPKTKDAILAALKAGQIAFENYYFNADGSLKDGFGPGSTFSIVDPKRDEAGYDVASKALKAAATTAKDTIIVLPLADGLKALQTFEAQTF